MIQLLVSLKHRPPWRAGDIVAAKSSTDVWGWRELRPARGEEREFMVIEHTDATLENALKGKPKAAPYRDSNRLSSKKVNLATLPTSVKAVLADPQQKARGLRVTVVNKGFGEA